MRRTFHTPLFYLISLIIIVSVNGRRGPHHPHSEIDKSRKQIDGHIAWKDEHIQDDLQNLQIDTKNLDEMTMEEKHFYYFKIHDTDNNNLLDGLELLQAANHHTNHLRKSNEIDDNEEINHVIEVIDNFIYVSDFDKNGYLDYPEYIKAIIDTEILPTDPQPVHKHEHADVEHGDSVNKIDN